MKMINLETSYSYEGLIEGNECKKKSIRKQKKESKKENKSETDAKPENIKDKINMETFSKARPKKKFNDGSSSSWEDLD